MSEIDQQKAYADRSAELAEKGLEKMQELEPDNPGLIVAAAVILITRLIAIGYGKAKAFEFATTVQHLLANTPGAPVASA